ncbi:MAG: type II toxin-antitoxin system VapB family antitoxin [Micropruina sp.]|uniref:type II toxin-antitoxin system VapB family antitoxin n=1 Tax=Micropruina sp. TaxID=2737536 RepID=UPI0039E3EB71
MGVKRTTIELDEALAAQAVDATGGTLRSTVEQGLRLLIAQGRHDEQRRQDLLDRHLASAAKGVDLDVLLSGEAWR